MKMKIRIFLWSVLAGLLIPAAGNAESSPKPTPKPTASADSADENTVDPQQLYDAGKALFDQYAPDDVKRDYEFPSRQDWDNFTDRVQQALQGGSLDELAALEPDVRRALVALKMTPQYSDYVDWLSERLDLIETARDAVAARTPGKTPYPPALPETPSNPETPSHPHSKVPSPVPDVNLTLPYYSVWLNRLHDRPKPPQADELMPLLKVIFSAEGIPPELAWLAEVESSLNPSARSPAGARGLFQLMPTTAKSLGLSLFPFDERVQPGKSARAAAKMLHRLHERFDDWPLALAAYNVGESKLAALLKKDQVNTFASVANDLPVETRMYVPKVFATLSVRENLPPSSLQNTTHRLDGQPDTTPETPQRPQKNPLADVALNEN